MIYAILNYEPNVSEVVTRGAACGCEPVKLKMQSGESIWVISGNLDLSGMTTIAVFETPSVCKAWLDNHIVEPEESSSEN